MIRINRRTFLKGAVGTAGAVALGGPALAASSKPSFRHLRPIPDERDGAVRLWLPEGFSYRSFHDTEDTVLLDDGTTLPGRHDGMGAFPGPNGNVILVRNHELNNPGAPFGDPANAYDPMGQAGTTTIEVTPRGEVVNSYTSLNGLVMSCAGGHMPWGSWMACEETVNGPDVGPDFTGVSNVPLQQPHGFIFDVPIDGVSDAQPITQAGRFAHEAAVARPQTRNPVRDRGRLPDPVRVLPLHSGDRSRRGRPARQQRSPPDARRQGRAERQPRRTPTATRHVRRRVGRYRRPGPVVPVHARPTRSDDEP